MTFGDALSLMVQQLSVIPLALTDDETTSYEVLVGDEHIDANGAPPRIVIVPMSAQPEGARMQAVDAATPRAIASEKHLFMAEIWAKGASDDLDTVGRDYVAVSSMRANFVRSMRDTFGVTFQLGPGAWSSITGESIDEDGRRYNQQFTLSQLTLDAQPLPQNIEHTTLNSGISDPGDDFTDDADL